MSEQWYKDYIQLAFRLDKALRPLGADWFIDAYYGPPAWKAEVESEQAQPAADLVRATMKLADNLQLQGFDARHTKHLAKQVLAMETIARKIAGEQFALEDEVQRILDIRPQRVPESQFEQAHAMLDEVLPGTGSLYERQQAFNKRRQIPADKMHLFPELIERTRAEVQRRTSAFVDLPEGEGLDIEIVTNRHYGGNCEYKGNYRSFIEINTDLPTQAGWLPDLMSHEGYPGHHTEAVCKERSLYRAQGKLSYSLHPLGTPESLVAEAIATLAMEMIFAPGEEQRWVNENLLPLVGLKPVEYDIQKMKEAHTLLQPVEWNAVFMLREGHPAQEVRQYLQKYHFLNDDEGMKAMEFLQVPLQDTYIFTYGYGKRLMKPWVQGEDRYTVFRRFLEEEWTPSDLVHPA